MNVYLDDERETPTGWFRAYWPSEVIKLLKTGKVKLLSLDHDLGNDNKGTGYDVLLWIEQAVFIDGFVPPKIAVHSANSSARIKMERAITQINLLAKNQKGSKRCDGEW
ncbi:cyclic-phosphate processing receiver domain-containing protein [Pseudoalteromonas sp. 2CM36K]|uniref:cyclic-phosphate processing receiver domain-containing protein n=1 Tax=Pseudoalteromonas sp. 2CM36K TaxID=2929854 RepID=UPI0020C0A427|nr:cyclic-phosphate processing receiver domain-containing protein [Pseudoalteromonas sp. 2CM36K]MCK8102238.1 hypothetical protein [Pseudoalteromonas sp. 2CM36K]